MSPNLSNRNSIYRGHTQFIYVSSPPRLLLVLRLPFLSIPSRFLNSKKTKIYDFQMAECSSCCRRAVLSVIYFTTKYTTSKYLILNVSYEGVITINALSRCVYFRSNEYLLPHFWGHVYVFLITNECVISQ